jgi:hypothetical protein
VLILLAPEEEKLFYKAELERGMVGLNIKRCPRPDCPGQLEVDDHDEDPRFQCPVEGCRNEHCLRCDVAWHEGSTCEQFQRRRAANALADDQVERLRAQRVFVRCPNPTCRQGVEKERPDQCNKIVRCSGGMTSNLFSWFSWFLQMRLSSRDHRIPSPCGAVT